MEGRRGYGKMGGRGRKSVCVWGGGGAGEEMGRREGGREEGGKTNLAVDLETCGPTTQRRRGLDTFIHNPFVDRRVKNVVCCHVFNLP